MTPLGYVDDGAEHQPQLIHSVRIPMPAYAARLDIHDIKVLHYALTRLDAHASKTRLYGAIENVLGISNAISRRYRYSSQPTYLQLGNVETTSDEWFTGWEEQGIDMHTINKQKYYAYDFEMLRYFHKYGLRRFWGEDVWQFDWEACRQYAKSLGMSNIPDYKITKPPKFLGFFLDMIAKLYQNLSSWLR